MLYFLAVTHRNIIENAHQQQGHHPHLYTRVSIQAAAVQTPNPLAQLTPAHGGAGGSSTRVLAGVSATPRLGGETPGVSIGATPLRYV